MKVERDSSIFAGVRSIYYFWKGSDGTRVWSHWLICIVILLIPHTARAAAMDFPSKWIKLSFLMPNHKKERLGMKKTWDKGRCLLTITQLLLSPLQIDPHLCGVGRGGLLTTDQLVVSKPYAYIWGLCVYGYISQFIYILVFA